MLVLSFNCSVKAPLSLFWMKRYFTDLTAKIDSTAIKKLLGFQVSCKGLCEVLVEVFARARSFAYQLDPAANATRAPVSDRFVFFIIVCKADRRRQSQL